MFLCHSSGNERRKIKKLGIAQKQSNVSKMQVHRRRAITLPGVAEFALVKKPLRYHVI
jgi:hypothetical protein